MQIQLCTVYGMYKQGKRVYSILHKDRSSVREKFTKVLYGKERSFDCIRYIIWFLVASIDQ